MGTLYRIPSCFAQEKNAEMSKDDVHFFACVNQALQWSNSEQQTTDKCDCGERQKPNASQRLKHIRQDTLPSGQRSLKQPFPNFLLLLMTTALSLSLYIHIHRKDRLSSMADRTSHRTSLESPQLAYCLGDRRHSAMRILQPASRMNTRNPGDKTARPFHWSWIHSRTVLGWSFRRNQVRHGRLVEWSYDWLSEFRCRKSQNTASTDSTHPKHSLNSKPVNLML